MDKMSKEQMMRTADLHYAYECGRDAAKGDATAEPEFKEKFAGDTEAECEYQRGLAEQQAQLSSDEQSAECARMSCDGQTKDEICKHLGISSNTYDRLLRQVISGARLPYNKRAFPKHREAILHNVALWLEYRATEDERHAAFLARLTKIDNRLRKDS